MLPRMQRMPPVERVSGWALTVLFMLIGLAQVIAR